jgi:CRP-like cAMP-binding protein
MVGRDGIVGGAAALNGEPSINRAVVQIGGQSLASEIETFKSVMAKHPSLHRLVGVHQEAKFAQAQQSAACNATHDLESRLARWLLRAADLHGGNDLPLTQEFLAGMLGGPSHQRFSDSPHFAAGGNAQICAGTYKTFGHSSAARNSV